jgi:hypothetical protein
VISALIAAASVVVIIESPVPTEAKVLTLIVIGISLAVCAADTIQIAIANVKAANARDLQQASDTFDRLRTMPAADWEHLQPRAFDQPERKHLPHKPLGAEGWFELDREIG